MLIPPLVGLKALEQFAPRDQAIQGIKMIDALKDRLSVYLNQIAEKEKRPVSEQDIQLFFAQEVENRNDSNINGNKNKKAKLN